MKMLLLISLFSLSFPVYAEHDFITNIHLASHHVGSESGEYNEENLGIGIEYKGMIAGTFSNSFKRQSYYVGYDLPLCGWCGVKGGAVTGYADKISPMIMAYAKIQQIEIGLIPPSPKNVTTITFGLWF